MQDFINNKTIEKLKYDIVRENIISFDDMNKAEKIAQETNQNLAQVIINEKLITEKDVLQFIENKLHIPYVNLEDYSLDKRFLTLISANDAKKYRLIPLFKIEDVLTIAMADPLDLFALNTFIEELNLKIEPVICSEKSILKAIKNNYKEEAEISKTNKEVYYDWQSKLTKESFENINMPVLIKAIFYQALKENFSRVIFEPNSKGIEVRFNNKHKGIIPSILSPLFFSNLKILLNIDPNISTIPQVGKNEFKIKELKTLINIATFPTTGGERIVLELNQKPKKLDSLEISPKNLEFIKECLNKKGLILACGPKLAGKTSIVYSLLNSIKNKAIMSIESLVKYNLKNVHQCELNEKTGFNHEKVRKFIQFQSPDVIFVENCLNSDGVNFIENCISHGQTIITEMIVDSLENIKDSNVILNLTQNRHDFATLNQVQGDELISCIIFIHKDNKIDVIKDFSSL